MLKALQKIGQGRIPRPMQTIKALHARAESRWRGWEQYQAVDPVGDAPKIVKLHYAHGGVCFYCGRRTVLRPKHPPIDLCATRDHILPRSRGGSNELFNMVLACRACNEEKGDGPVPLSYLNLVS